MKKKVRLGVPGPERLGSGKRGLFGPPLRVGQIGKELHLAHAKPS